MSIDVKCGYNLHCLLHYAFCAGLALSVGIANRSAVQQEDNAGQESDDRQKYAGACEPEGGEESGDEMSHADPFLALDRNSVWLWVYARNYEQVSG